MTATSSVLNWEQQVHPDFQADMQSSATRPPAQHVNGRIVLLGLLLLLLIPLGWWLWSTRDDARSVQSAGGVVVTLPTLAATDAVGNEASAGILPAITPTATATEAAAETAPAAAATAEPTATDLENIAATATALFVEATVVTDCVAPGWWVEYVVEEGDTLTGLAETRGILPEELIVANCLVGPELPVGQVLWLPPVGVIVSLPEQPTATATRATASPVPTLRPTGLPIILFPTPTIPVVIIIPTSQPSEEPPTEEPATRPPRPTNAPTAAVPPTVTPPNPFVTPPGGSPTATPPVSTVNPTLTPPGGGVTATTTATSTPPPVP
jgi:LysM repeat protein